MSPLEKDCIHFARAISWDHKDHSEISGNLIVLKVSSNSLHPSDMSTQQNQLGLFFQTQLTYAAFRINCVIVSDPDYNIVCVEKS